MSNKNIDDIDDIDEESLRERMNASEKQRGERRKIREESKKNRRRRVEKIIHGDNPPRITEQDKMEEYKNTIFLELEKREKNIRRQNEKNGR